MTTLAYLPSTRRSDGGLAAHENQARRLDLLDRATIVAPLVGLGVGALLSFKSDRTQRLVGLGALGASLCAALARWQLQRAFTEHPLYRVELKTNDIEVRSYAPTVRAETVIETSSWEQALNEGFRHLAGYIFGDNATGAKIPMTAPVLATMPLAASAHEESVRAASSMTTLSYNRIGGRTVAFIMPAERLLGSLPAPNDRRVQLREVPRQRMAVLRFTGRYGGTLPAEKRDALLQRVRVAGLTPLGEVFFAGYDPPSTLPWLRRNEVMVEVDAANPMKRSSS